MELNKIKYDKKVKFHRLDKKPKKQFWFFTWLIHFLSVILMGWRTKIEKINMRGIKGPYVLLSNHHAFTDFEVNSLATFPRRVNNIATLEGHYRRAYLLELCGCIPKRKFSTDPFLIKQCETVLNEYKSILSIYPEARYSPIGTTAIIPDVYAGLLKRLGKPVCVLLHRGNYLRAPAWGWRKKRKVKTFSTMKLILTKEDIEAKSEAEIMEIIKKELDYNEYKYQKENNIVIDAPFRAEGLHNVLYQCPSCKSEHHMTSFGSVLKCENCQKEWEMTTLGELKARVGDTEFSHIPDWFEWERTQVREQIDKGEYSFEDTVQVYSLPNTSKFIPLGNATLKHQPKSGFTIEGHYNNEDYKISRPVAGLYGVHIEFDYCYIRPEPCIHISTSNDTFVCYPEKKNVVMKLLFATEELYKCEMAERNERRAQRRLERERSKEEQ